MKHKHDCFIVENHKKRDTKGESPYFSLLQSKHGALWFIIEEFKCVISPWVIISDTVSNRVRKLVIKLFHLSFMCGLSSLKWTVSRAAYLQECFLNYWLKMSNHNV